MSCKKILITGIQGTIGSGIAKTLKNKGYYPIGLGRRHNESQYGFSLHSDLKNPNYVRCDIGDYRQLSRVFEDLGPFDFVYNCAAEFGRWNGEDYYENLWRTNAMGTKNIIRLQEKFGFKLIHFSSSEVYGDYPNIMVESVMDDYEIKQLNDYAMSKWVNEMQIKNSAIQYGTESVVVRIFNTYGPGEYYSPYRSVNCRFLYCALKGLEWTVYRGHSRTSTYLQDTVNTLSNIIDNFKPGETYNIGGKDLHTIEDLSEIIIDITGADSSLASYKDSEVLTTKTKVVDISKSIKDLGHQNSIDLVNGIRKTADWMKSVYEF
ncbi:MAG: nucleoside-diphosphate sugar epimerase [Euryarchaeota archaeon]|nr:nucleoside-diphosphate sugar epimerase [Euryarchaeota archaeon]